MPEARTVTRENRVTPCFVGHVHGVYAQRTKTEQVSLFQGELLIINTSYSYTHRSASVVGVANVFTTQINTLLTAKQSLTSQ